MKKALDLIRTNWRVFTWTGFYVFVMWAVLRGLFGFNMFSAHHWIRMLHVELHGFAGLVFGIFVLAAVPMYVATTVLTVRNKSLPVKIPLPNCLCTPEPAKTEDVKEEPLVVEQDVLPALRAGVPQEMREAFMYANKNSGIRQRSVFNRMPMSGTGVVSPKQDVIVPKVSDEPIVPISPEPVPILNTSDTSVVDTNTGLPIPDDFDVSSCGDSDDFGVPVFSDINFDDEDEDTDDGKKEETENTPDALAQLCSDLKSANIDTHVSNDLVCTDKFVIAIHQDDDFWVADELDWFAAGKQKPSPIKALMNCKENLKPVLYLSSTNIMDVDKLIDNCKNDGITVVTEYDELVKLVQEG